MNIVRVIVTVLLCVFVLSACQTAGVKYRYKDTFYPTAQEALSAQSVYNTLGLDSVEPLAEPISDKKLIFAIPSYSTMQGFYRKSFEGQGAVDSLNDYYALETYRAMKALYFLVKKSNIYVETKFIETSGGDVQPNEESDVLYVYATSLTNVATYYASSKNGKQVWTFDRSHENPSERAQAVLDAVLSYSLR